MQSTNKKCIAGAQEWCALPMLEVAATKARVDSGAKTSAIHAFNIEPFTRNSKPWVRFDIHPLQSSRLATIRCESPIADRRVIKSSNGSTEKRFVIKTPLALNGQSWDIELTLANRDTMGFRMLLGREAMSGRILVDSAEEFLLGQTTKAAESVINAMKSLRANLLVQEYIAEAGGTDLRCFMIDGNAIQRKAAPGRIPR